MSSGLKFILGQVKKIDNTEAFMGSLRGAIMPVIQRTTEDIERIVKTTAPFRTGNLRRSYHLQLFPDQLRAQVGSDPAVASYAPHVEFGTKKQAAQPHLGPAGMSQRYDFTKNLRNAIEDTVVKWGGKK